MIFAELLQDDTCAYGLLICGGWHFFGAQITNAVLATPIGHAIYSFVMPFIA